MANQEADGYRAGEVRLLITLHIRVHCNGGLAAYGVEEMREKIDWSKAPESAMVLLKHTRDGAYAVAESFSDDARTWYWPDPRYSFRLMPAMWRVVAERPTTQSWSGEGLPPVGTVCEFKSPSSGGWSKARIVFVSGWTIVLYVFFEHDEHCYSVSAFEKGNLKFRPIRTPEQIESAARIEAAQEWLKSIELEYGEDAADQCESILMAAEAKRMAKL